MKKLKIFAALLSISVCLASCNAPAQEKVIHHSSATFPQMTIETITAQSEHIVHGIVTQKKDAVVFEYETAAGTKQQVYTPYEIRITDDIKGNVDGKTIDFLAYGGETDTDIYIFAGDADVNVGDEVLAFLDAHGISWGAQGVYVVEDGNISIYTHMLPTDTLNDDEENQSTFTQISLDDYMQLISEYVNE